MIRHKFRNVITETDGIKFASRKESQYYQNLKLLKLGGVVLFCRSSLPSYRRNKTNSLCM